MSIRQNKFARRAKERQEKTKNVVHDATPTVDEQLSRLEDDGRRLKIEFDIFFNGASKRPPYDTKNRVDSVIKRLAEDRTFTFAQRYRYNSIVARYNAFRELWRRTLQEREEGRGTASAARTAARSDAEALKAKPSVFVCADARKELPVIKNLYDTLIEAKRNCGEAVDDLSFPRFHHLITQQADALKQRHGCERVYFSVGVEDGRVSFKAKADT